MRPWRVFRNRDCGGWRGLVAPVQEGDSPIKRKSEWHFLSVEFWVDQDGSELGWLLWDFDPIFFFNNALYWKYFYGRLRCQIHDPAPWRISVRDISLYVTYLCTWHISVRDILRPLWRRIRTQIPFRRLISSISACHFSHARELTVILGMGIENGPYQPY